VDGGCCTLSRKHETDTTHKLNKSHGCIFTLLRSGLELLYGHTVIKANELKVVEFSAGVGKSKGNVAGLEL
jgi:hypothetical protein